MKDKDAVLVLRNLGAKLNISYEMPSIKPPKEILEHYLFDGEIIFSKAKMYAIKKNDVGGFTVYILDSRRGNPPLELLYWHQLLEKGMIFVHAAGITQKDEAIIFPAWPEVGKTTLIITLLRLNKSLMLLGDDMVILSTNGFAYPYPRPFAVYSYHVPLFLNYFKRHPLDLLRLKTASIFIKTGIYSRFLKTFKIAEPLWIPYSRIFPGRLADRGRLEKVYLLMKTSSNTSLEIESVDLEIIINHMYLCIIYDLIAPFLQDAIVLTYFGFINLFDDLQRYLKYLKNVLTRCECYRIILPRNADFNDVAVKVFSHINSMKNL